MAGRKRSPALTDAEHRIMHVLWDHPGSTVGDVVERMEGPARPAYNSVLTILRILERKGYVSHEKDGRAFVYSAVVNRQQARRGALSHLLSRFFNGSREELVMDLFGHEPVDAEELAKVKALLERHPGGRSRRGRA
ncbi:MAG TPA: BlaI/MecI/CopY family transcriptional regulator [Vicinamibacterales bacterium]|nr:BlaI/MecI/CopY family transcriptional regulator [Vicinamibacterales bacterium]